MSIRNACRVAAIATALLAPSALAAAPDEIVTGPLGDGLAAASPGTVYELDTEIVVHDWVLCVSQALAEELVRAREESTEKAWMAFASSKEAKTCGQVAELRVILQERLYVSAATSGHDARAFGALVNLTGFWASAYVVYGGLPEQ